ADFRIVRRVEVGPEGTVPIRPYCAREEETVLPGELLLSVDTECLVLLKCLGRVAAGSATDISRARNWELIAGRHLLVELLVVVLRTGRRGRHEIRRNRPVRVRTIVGGEERASQSHGLLLAKARRE